MAKSTSISLGDHFEGFISSQIDAGRYGNVSEVVRASLRLLEEHEQRVEAAAPSSERRGGQRRRRSA